MEKISAIFRFSSQEMLIFGGLVPQRVDQWLNRRMVSQTSLASSDETSIVVCPDQFPNLVVLSDSSVCSWREYVFSLFQIREEGYSGRAVVITESPSYGDLRYALDNQISDYIVPSPYIDIEKELKRVIETPKCIDAPKKSETIRRMGLFRSFGLSSGQIDLLVAYASSFSRFNDLADTLGKTEGQLRKAFSRIYDKLRGPLSLDCPARLAHVLTLCLQVP